MSVSFSLACFDIGSIDTRHETSHELLTSSRDRTLPRQQPIPDSGPNTPILGNTFLEVGVVVLGPTEVSEAHLGRVGLSTHIC